MKAMPSASRPAALAALIVGAAITGACGWEHPSASNAAPLADPSGRWTTVPLAASPTEPSTTNEPATAAQVDQTIAADGFPAGHGTAEGVACDLARAFITADADVFREACLPVKRGSKTGDAYNDFLDDMEEQMRSVHGQPLEPYGGPKAIHAVYRARDLSAEGPASFAYAMRMSELKFVDVETPMWDGTAYTNRTLVVQLESTKKWYAIPRPDLFPLMSMGLNGESRSSEQWTP